MGLLELGRIEITPAASAALAEVDGDPSRFLDRHERGDWGDVEERQRQYNDWARHNEGIVWSTYALCDGVDLKIGTARDRSYTSVMLETEFERREVSALEGYAQWADYYDLERNPLVAVEEPHVEAILDRLDVKTALDVGAGTGRIALKLARRGVTVTAIDQSAEMLAVAKQSARREALAIDFRLISIEDGLPFDAARFDLVTCALMLCHVPDLDQAVRAFSRVLHKGGYLLITDFHPDGATSMGWRTVAVRPEGSYALPNMPHTRADYLQAVKGAGLNLLDVQDVPVRDVPEGCFAFHDRLVREHGDVPLCLIVLGQKGSGD
jgi:malonyl-CoA O-methyltransferase